MTKTRNAPGGPAPTLAERLAPMTIAEIDAMNDREVAELMGATAEEIDAEPAWTWREAAKAATDEYADRLAAGVESGRATMVADPSETRRRLGGRPRVGGDSGEGPSNTGQSARHDTHPHGPGGHRRRPGPAPRRREPRRSR